MKPVLSLIVLLPISLATVAAADTLIRLPDAIPGPKEEASRTALYDAYSEARNACELGQDGSGAELSKNQRANKCFETDTIDRWVTAQGGCINDALASILTPTECREVEECVRAHENEPEMCD